jgi:hypothetical protein
MLLIGLIYYFSILAASTFFFIVLCSWSSFPYSLLLFASFFSFFTLAFFSCCSPRAIPIPPLSFFFPHRRTYREQSKAFRGVDGRIKSWALREV